jgi:hypothetical protein
MHFIYKSILLFFFISISIDTNGQSDLVVPSGISVEFSSAEYYSSRDLLPDAQIEIRATSDVVYNNRVIIKAGARGKGVVTSVMKARGLGKKGLIEIKPLSITAVDGQIIPVDGVPYRATGDDKKTLVYALACGGCFFVGPFSLFFLLIKGENALISPVLTLKGNTANDITISY